MGNSVIDPCKCENRAKDVNALETVSLSPAIKV